MRGIDAATGKKLSGKAHLYQSIKDILTTPIGTRVGRREYGSRVPELVDRPLNKAGLVEIYAATAEALDKWEPRITVTRVTAVRADGNIVIELEGRYLPDGNPINFDGIIVT